MTMYILASEYELINMPSPQNSWIVRRFAGIFLTIMGWKVTGENPVAPRAVIIAAPHTSNWDFVYLIAAAAHLGIKINWLGKASLFRQPLGFFMKRFGGIAVDRSKRNDLVQQLTAKYKQHSRINLVIPPAGTRDHTDHWKSGFYHLAIAARVPIICGYLDYPSRKAGLSKPFELTGKVELDMEAIRRFYKNKVGLYPEKSSLIRLREEDNS